MVPEAGTAVVDERAPLGEQHLGRDRGGAGGQDDLGPVHGAGQLLGRVPVVRGLEVVSLAGGLDRPAREQRASPSEAQGLPDVVAAVDERVGVELDRQRAVARLAPQHAVEQRAASPRPRGSAFAVRSRRVSRMRRCRSRSQVGWPIAGPPTCRVSPPRCTSVRRSTSGSASASGSGAAWAAISPNDRRTSRLPVQAHGRAHDPVGVEQERAERAVLERAAHDHAVPGRREPGHLHLRVVLVATRTSAGSSKTSPAPSMLRAACSPILIALSKCSTRIGPNTGWS